MLQFSIRLLFVCAVGAAGKRVREKNGKTLGTTELAIDLPNWMGQLAPVIGDATILDLTLPGAHDAMTADLTDNMIEGYQNLLHLSRFLHKIMPQEGGPFIKQMSQAQGLHVTAMLDAGVRFIDFRILFSKGPSAKSKHKDWYNHHCAQSKHTAITYLQQVRTWLDAHPKEIVVFWVSRHGDNRKETVQYAGTTPEQRQHFFNAVKEVFSGKMFNTTEWGLDSATIGSLWERGTQVVWYCADYAESTASSPLAIDDGRIQNNVPDKWPPPWVPELQDGFAIRGALRANGTFWLLGMAMRGYVESCYIERAALLWYVSSGFKTMCSRCFRIPGIDKYCPASVQDLGQLTNYYVQRDLEMTYLEGALNPDIDFPNAIYIDGLDEGGLVRTGTQRNNPLPGNKRVAPASDHETTGYAFVATMIGTNLRRLCRGGVHAPKACKDLMQAVEAMRAKAPFQTWSDPANGRLKNFPESSNWTQGWEK